MTDVDAILKQRFRLLTCVMPAGRGGGVLERLEVEHRIISAAVNHARGVGSDVKRQRRRLYFREKDVLMALVHEEQAEAVFAFLYGAAGIQEPHAGMVFMSQPMRGMPMLPDLPMPAEDVRPA